MMLKKKIIKKIEIKGKSTMRRYYRIDFPVKQLKNLSYIGIHYLIILEN